MANQSFFWTEPFLNLDLISRASAPDALEILVKIPKFHSTVYQPKNSWDNHQWSTYFNLVDHQDQVFLYYRGNLKSGNTNYHKEHTCVAISQDGGYTFTAPKLNLVAISPDKSIVPNRKKKKALTKKKKVAPPTPVPPSTASTTPTEPTPPSTTPTEPTPPSTTPTEPTPQSTTTEVTLPKPTQSNNIVWSKDAITHNFFAFRGSATDPEIHAIGGVVASSCRCCGNGMCYLSSKDGLNWTNHGKSILANTSQKQAYPTHYDSLNTVTYDHYREEYRAFLRFNCARAVRCIQTTTSSNLTDWRKSSLLKYHGNKPGYYYTPIITMSENSPYFLGFPCSQPDDKRSHQVIDFLFSRDGVHFETIKNKWMDKFSVSPERMIIPIRNSPDGKQHLIYINDAKNTQVKLYTLRRGGFSSIQAKDSSTKPVWFQTIPIFVQKPKLYFNFKRIKPDLKNSLRVDCYACSLNPSNQEQAEAETIRPEHILSLQKTVSQLNTGHQRGKLLQSFIIKHPDSLNHCEKLGKKMFNRYLIFKFTLVNTELFGFSYHTDKSKVINPKIDQHLYKSIRDRRTQNLHSSEKPIAKSPKKKSPPPATISDPEPLDLTHLEKLNAHLAQKPKNQIKYLYYDLLYPDNTPNQERVLKLKAKVTKISNFEYQKFNHQGGGNPTYGKICTFQVHYDIPAEPKTEQITLIKNSKSNCKVEFLV